MTYEEWKQKKKHEKAVKDYLEKSRQREFADRQSSESVFTRPVESIVDPDSV
jgi:hypothetical protein